MKDIPFLCNLGSGKVYHMKNRKSNCSLRPMMTWMLCGLDSSDVTLHFYNYSLVGDLTLDDAHN